MDMVMGDSESLSMLSNPQKSLDLLSEYYTSCEKYMLWKIVIRWVLLIIQCHWKDLDGYVAYASMVKAI